MIIQVVGVVFSLSGGGQLVLGGLVLRFLLLHVSIFLQEAEMSCFVVFEVGPRTNRQLITVKVFHCKW